MTIFTRIACIAIACCMIAPVAIATMSQAAQIL